ncbi:MAG: flagellin, partial [Acidobacteriaceae bacterium]
MSLTILNSVSSLTAENALSSTQASLQKTLTELSTGLKINSGSDDAAGLAIANGLGANISALTQSSQNASDGVGLLQTADGALSQVTSLLNRAVTLATEASNGGLSTSQSDALNTEYQSILSEIGNIGSTTNFNGEPIFGTSATVYTSDGTTSGSDTVTTAIGALTTTALALDTTQDTTPGTTTAADLSTAAGAQGALALITAAISTVAANRGAIGAAVNQLTADQNVQNTEVTNLTSAQNNIQNADIGQTVAQMTQFNVLE